MLNIAAQSITKKAPQQAARIQQATRTITTDSFAFYPVRKTRYDQIVPTSMFQANTQAASKKAPQQVARIHSPTGPAENHSFAFYPVEKNRVRKVTPKINRDCYGFYPANVETTKAAQTLQTSAPMKNVKAVRAALKQKKQTRTSTKTSRHSVLHEIRAVKKTTTALP
ncbi:unnamed protein product [Cylindrotheca closterium]|uniref:Uncharacterized protein n=1 Tax=Cylindrotheca closterium TaxID=2856 RepID=A0AAD2FLN6_9STRA|nr:unnamed protein product [Cylindrotheca closterium]